MTQLFQYFCSHGFSTWNILPVLTQAVPNPHKQVHAPRLSRNLHWSPAQLLQHYLYYLSWSALYLFTTTSSRWPTLHVTHSIKPAPNSWPSPQACSSCSTMHLNKCYIHLLSYSSQENWMPFTLPITFPSFIHSFFETALHPVHISLCPPAPLR